MNELAWTTALRTGLNIWVITSPVIAYLLAQDGYFPKWVVVALTAANVLGKSIQSYLDAKAPAKSAA